MMISYFIIGISLILLSICRTSENAALGFRPCDPEKDGPMCHVVGQFGDQCNELNPCARGLYCKRRSHASYYCDNGVEETHRSLKHLLSGCLNNFTSSNEEQNNLPEITAHEMKDLLSSYYLTNDEKAFLEDERHLNGNSKITNNHKFCSLQETAVGVCDLNLKKSCVRASRLENINTRLIDETIGNQTNLPEPKQSTFFYRIDNRLPADLRKAGGFFGVNPISLNHAKLVAPALASLPCEHDELAEFRRLNREPFVLTSKEEYKPAKASPMLVYKLKVPVTLPSKIDNTTESGKRELIFNGKNIQDSQIIGVKSGDDVSFLTGLSASFIQGVDFNDGRGFLSMPDAMKRADEMAKMAKKHSKHDTNKEITVMVPLEDSGKNDESD
eukprot:TCONS_00003292-protein